VEAFFQGKSPGLADEEPEESEDEEDEIQQELLAALRKKKQELQAAVKQRKMEVLELKEVNEFLGQLQDMVNTTRQESAGRTQGEEVQTRGEEVSRAEETGEGSEAKDEEEVEDLYGEQI
jgi:hypothetical protein